MEIYDMIEKRLADLKKLEELVLLAPLEMKTILYVGIGFLKIEINDLRELKK